MPDMTNYQHLIDSHFQCRPDIAKTISSVADGATDNISMAIASIGSLMYHAAENDEYDKKAMRIDMSNIGLLLGMLGNFGLSIRTAQENAEYALQTSSKASTDTAQG